MDPSFLITQVTEDPHSRSDSLATKPPVSPNHKVNPTNGHIVNNNGGSDGQVGNKLGIEANNTNDVRLRFIPNLILNRKLHKNGATMGSSKFFHSFLCCVRIPRPHIISKMAAKARTGKSIHEENQSSNASRPLNDPRSPGTFIPYVPDLETHKQNGHVVLGECVPSAAVNGSTLLPCVENGDGHKMCVVIDLDETLVHSSFKPVQNADYIVPVNIDNIIHHVYVMKRPHVDTFLQEVGERFECILFTASLAKYADPVADLLDKRRIFRARLFREACVFHQGNYVKDLNRLGRDTEKVVIIDNSPASYIFHPQNAIPISSWFGDSMDRELLNVLPILDKVYAERTVTKVLAKEIGQTGTEPGPT